MTRIEIILGKELMNDLNYSLNKVNERYKLSFEGKQELASFSLEANFR